jgi:maltose operon substrate-binding protein precursor MalM
MRHFLAVLAAITAAALAGCATQPSASYPPSAEGRLASYARATPCCDDPSGFQFSPLPKQGYANAVVDPASPVFDFQSGLSPFAAFELPEATAPYRVRVKSLFDRRDGGASGAFYPVVALLDETFIVVHITGLESLRLEPSLATAGGEPGLAVSLGIDPREQKGKYLVVFTPAALLGQAPANEREGDVLSLSSLAFMERGGESVLPPSPYGRIRITIAPEIVMSGNEPVEQAKPPGSD